jgi:glycosyltransferase involved in cell wall biosynthesis
MRILHVIGTMTPEHGGPDVAVFELARELAAAGESVSIWTTNLATRGDFRFPLGRQTLDVPTGRTLVREGVEIRYFPGTWPSRWRASWPMARALQRGVTEFDLVHIHTLYSFPTLAASRACLRAGVPYLLRPHGMLDPYLRRRRRWRKLVYESLIERRTLEGAAAIHFTTREEMRLTAPLGLRAPGIVVPLGVRPEEYARLPEPGAFRAAHPEIGDRRIVLYLGRLNFKKGLDLLARAFGNLLRRRDDLHLVLAGPDQEGFGRRVRRWLDEAGALGHATFSGMLRGEAKLAALAAADVWALPSYTENFGLAVVEAIAAGVPVVISDQVNIWPEIAAARAGVVVRCDAGELAAALERVLDNPEEARGMAGRGRELVQRRFAWPRVAAEMLAVYRSILGGAACRSAAPRDDLTAVAAAERR